MTDLDDRISTNTEATEAIVPVLPVPVPVNPYHRDSPLIVFTKFLSWLTAVLLATAVIISLVSVTSERDNLRDQIAAQSTELTCRAEANVEVSKASAEKQIALAAHSAIVGEFVVLVIQGDRESPDYVVKLDDLATRLTKAGERLTAAGTGLQAAVENQEDALKDCDKS